FIAECEAGSPHYQESSVRSVRAHHRLARGDSDGALADAELGLALAREGPDPQSIGPALARLLHVAVEVGLDDPARGPSGAAIANTRGFPAAPPLVELAGVASTVGIDAELETILEPLRPMWWHDGPLAVLRGDHEEAASVYDEAGAHGLAALARLRGAEA